MWEPPQNSGCQKGDIKQVPYSQILDTTITNLHTFPVNLMPVVSAKIKCMQTFTHAII